MSLLILKKRAQAAAEVAICGSLFLMVLGVLVSYGVKFNAQQELMMKSFRHALRKASSDNIGDAYLAYGATYIKDIPVPNITSPYGVSKLSEISTLASATRSYFMLNVEQPVDEKGVKKTSFLPRTHYIVNDQDLHGNNPEKDGFTTAGLREGSFKPAEEKGRCEIIRIIPDPEDKLEPYDIYWTWIKITVPLIYLQSDPKDEYHTRTKYTIEEILNDEAQTREEEEIKNKDIWEAIKEYYPNYKDWSGAARNIIYEFFYDDIVGDYVDTDKWGREKSRQLRAKLEEEHSGVGMNEVNNIISMLGKFFADLSNLIKKVTISEDSAVINLGTDFSLSEAISENDLTEKVKELPIIAQGTQLSSDCLEGVENPQNRRKLTVITIEYPDKYPSEDPSRVFVKDPYLGEINPGSITKTARGLAKQGLLPKKKSETTFDFKLTTSAEQGKYSATTEVISQDTITRYIKLNNVEEEIEIENTRNINK